MLVGAVIGGRSTTSKGPEKAQVGPRCDTGVVTQWRGHGAAKHHIQET